MFQWIKNLLSGGGDQRCKSAEDYGYELEDEDLDALGCIVTVLSQVNSLDTEGRIRFRGTTWPAMSLSGVLEPDESAKIVFRQNIAWIVESYDGILKPGERELF